MKAACISLASVLALGIAPALHAQDVALFEFTLGSYDLSAEDDNDSDFDNGGVFVPNGQAQFRLGNVIAEIQGTTTSSVDDGDEDENSSSFGMFGYYAGQLNGAEIAFGGGVAGGTNVEESDGTWYTQATVAYARDGWSIGLGRLSYLGGQGSDDSLQGFTFLQGAYGYQFGSGTLLTAEGYYGQGKTSDDPTVTGYNLELGVEQPLSDKVSATASVGKFGLLRDDEPRANGVSFSLGLNVAIGGNMSTAKSSLPFDTVNLHREITWCDEASC